MTRRDYTNQHGYICPTENEAIRNADRKPDPPRKPSPGVMREEDIKAMDKHRKAQSLVDFVAGKPEAEEEREKGCEYCKSRFGIATHHVTESGMQAGTNKAAAFCPMCGRKLDGGGQDGRKGEAE